MKRRHFIHKAVAGGAAVGLGSGVAMAGSDDALAGSPITGDDEVVIERPASGKPHAGKVLAAIQPHSDDIPLFAAGTVAKLIREGYTGYLIQTSNDDHAGRGATRLRRRLSSEKRRLPILGNDDETANRAYIKHIVLDAASERLRGVPSDASVGEQYGLEWAERFHYFGPSNDELGKYIEDNAVPS